MKLCQILVRDSKMSAHWLRPKHCARSRAEHFSRFKTCSSISRLRVTETCLAALSRYLVTMSCAVNGRSTEPRFIASRSRITRPSLSSTITSPSKYFGNRLAGSTEYWVIAASAKTFGSDKAGSSISSSVNRPFNKAVPTRYGMLNCAS